MANKINLTFLGTGANGGLPQMDCNCVFCKSKASKPRLRNGILFEIDQKKILIDASPDIRAQLSSVGLMLQDIDLIIISHLHWDHCGGLVELSCGRPLNINILCSAENRETLKVSSYFSFLFEMGFARFSKRGLGNVKPRLFKVKHDSNFPTSAIKITSGDKNVLVATDVDAINRKFLREIKKSDLVVFDGTFYEKSLHNHICIKQSASVLSKHTKNVVYTHINHSENIKGVNKYLSRFGFTLAFDGMRIKV